MTSDPTRIFFVRAGNSWGTENVLMGRNQDGGFGCPDHTPRYGGQHGRNHSEGTQVQRCVTPPEDVLDGADVRNEGLRHPTLAVQPA